MHLKTGNLFVGALVLAACSATAGAETFTAYLNGAQEAPVPVATSATGYARIIVNPGAGTLTFTVVFNGLTSNQTLSHIHAPAALGSSAGVIIDFGTVGGTSGTISGTRSITPTQLGQLRSGLAYVNVHSSNFPSGEVRGQLQPARPVDFDGDGRTDFSILRFPSVAPPATAQITYYNNNSTTGFQAMAWGDANTDFPAPGDYDGDAQDDFVVYRDGANSGDQSAFFIFKSSNGTFQGVNFGLSGDQPVSRDFDGDGIVDVAVYRRGVNPNDQAYWYIYRTSTLSLQVVPWGLTGDVFTGSNGDTPVTADYDGDGKFDVAVYRFGGLVPDNSNIILNSSDGSVKVQQWGNFQTDYVAPGDFDGDGKSDFVAVRTGAGGSSPMVWWILQSSNGGVRIQQFGISSDRVTQGDYDGDGRIDLSIFRSSTGTFWTLNSFANALTTNHWGQNGDFPTATFNAR